MKVPEKLVLSALEKMDVTLHERDWLLQHYWGGTNYPAPGNSGISPALQCLIDKGLAVLDPERKLISPSELGKHFVRIHDLMPLLEHTLRPVIVDELNQLISSLSSEQLPELLSHRDSLVRHVAALRFRKLQYGI